MSLLCHGLVAGFLVFAAPVPKRSSEVLLVQDSERLQLLGFDGNVRTEFSARVRSGSLAPNGWWVAYYEFVVQEPFRDLPSGFIVVRPLTDEPPHKLPPAFGVWGFNWQFVWSQDRRRVLIAESSSLPPNADRPSRTFRVYELESRTLTDVPLNTPNPAETWVSGWSADGKRLLGQVGMRVAWLSFDGQTPPEFITPETELAYGGRLSPDGRHILYMSRVDTIKNVHASYQLFVRDLRSGESTRITPDDGITDSFCWNPDGTRIAYTLREVIQEKPDDDQYPTHLFADDAAGGNRRLVTTRKMKEWPHLVHFQVHDWR